MGSLFEGIKVLDFTNNLAGPVVTLMLATFGAEVIKIEKPGKGDDSRGFGTKFEGESVFFLGHNRGKKSVALEMKKPEAMEIIRRLVAQTDVVVESFRPGVMARLGLGFDDLKKINPKIIMCSVSAFGQTGPYSKLAGYDIIAQGMSGIMDVTGESDGPPMKVGPSIGDYVTGLNAFGAISAALYYRAVTGKGQAIDTGLVDCLIAANDYAEYAFNGFPVKRSGNHHGLFAPYGVYNGTGGNIVIGILNQKLWNDFCEVIGQPQMIDNPKYDDPGKRRQELPEVIAVIEAWLKKFPDIDEPSRILKEKGIPCTKVNSLKDLMTDPQILHRQMVVDMEVPYISTGKIKTKGIQIKFSETPGEIGIPPRVGEHQADVLQSIGYTDKDIAELKRKGVF
jgi:CoA:oxalate CoA-transferase